MSATEIFQFVSTPITAHSFNKAKNQVAFCPNTNEVFVYELAGGEWRQAHVLKGHDKVITSIDWGHLTNRIVTASQDRNAYVWNWDAPNSEWKPTLVLLRINRAATFVRWSPLENKFAVGSGARCISICYFDQDHDWWVSKHLKKPIRSTVLSVDWHPNNVLLAAGCADMRCRVFSAWIKGVDEKPAPSPWGDRLPFNTLCAEYVGGHGSWVHGVKFSPDGNALAFVGHDSTVCIGDPAKGTVAVVATPSLSFYSVIWVTANSVVAAGADCCPILFSGNDAGEWQMVERLDQAQKKAAAGGNTAFNKFKQMDNRGQSEQASTELTTVHQNTIVSIRIHDGPASKVAKFSTSGIDGKIVVWDLKTIESSISGLSIV